MREPGAQRRAGCRDKGFCLLLPRCMDWTHGGHMYGDIVDTLSPAIRVVEIDGSQFVATEVDVEVIRSLLART